nr:CpsD/CapB family tyrosine-protein kinase [Bacillus sp. Marseille-P3661]
MALRRKSKKTSFADSKHRSLITHYEKKSPISEQYRTIRTNIEFAAVDQNLKTIVITSAGPAEGKSTTVANLAVVFAQQDKKVLLIDADLRKPTVHYTMKVDNTVGLTNVLTGQATLEDAIKSTEVDHLSVLTSGPIPPNPAEMLGSIAMKKLLQNCAEQFDMILIDSPPVLAVTDAHVLANIADGSILITKSGQTEYEMAIKASDLLRNAKAKLLGAVLNHKELKQNQYYYYYGNK